MEHLNSTGTLIANRRLVPPHSGPLPWGGGGPLPVQDTSLSAGFLNTRSTILPPHEPQGRARLSRARRAADAKWKRRARDRRALPLLGSGVRCANLSGNSLPKGEGRGEGKLDVEST